MNIYGLQRVTLLDYPGKVACTVFLQGCNFHCPYCHNKILAYRRDNKPVMSEKQFLAWLSKRKRNLDGVVISGGEPTLYTGLNDFIKEIKDIWYPVKLDTNGYRPKALKSAIYDAKVDYVAMDIKNSPEKYCMTAGIPTIDCAKIKEFKYNKSFSSSVLGL